MAEFNPEIYHTAKASNAALQATLWLSGIEHLKAPSPNSNYLNWYFFLDRFLQATKVSYTLVGMDVDNRPATWVQDNMAVCSVITREVQLSNN
jgi:hypothetical protein